MRAQPTIMNAIVRTVYALIVLLMSLTHHVSAGPYEDAKAAAKRGDHETALRMLRILADDGDGRGQNGLGVAFQHGLGVPVDYAEALKWYRLAAEQGLAHAQGNLGRMYAAG